MPIGLVKWFDPRKGYGFIRYNESGELPEMGDTSEDMPDTKAEGDMDIFVHYSAIETDEDTFKTLYQGEKVDFKVTEGDKGPQASEVKILEKAPRRTARRYD
ncbi:MAG: cold-shock protein [Promethearchaeota archaeon]